MVTVLQLLALVGLVLGATLALGAGGAVVALSAVALLVAEELETKGGP